MTKDKTVKNEKISSNDSGAPKSVNVHFGLSLKQARKAKDMTVDDIFNTLHINKVYIEAIENERHDKLPEPAFVRGYIRNYANFLNIDPAEILVAYNQSSGDAKNISTTANESDLVKNISAGSLKTSKSSKSAKKAIGLGVLFWVLVFASWKIWNSLNQPPELNDSVTTWQDWVNPDVEDRGDALDVLGPGTSGHTADPLSQNQVPQNTPVVTSAAELEEPTALNQTLTLTLTEKVWVQIKQDQDLVFRGEMEVGEFVKSIEPPVHLRIGNAKSVSLSYGGESIDLTPHTKNSLATLSLILKEAPENQ